MFRKVLSVSAVIALTSLLTACDPPMPEELIVELAERQVVCPETSIDVKSTESLVGVTSFWNDNFNIACNLNYNLVEAVSTGVEFSDTGAFQCQPFLTLPASLDGAVVAFLYGENYEMNFDAEILAGIFSGEITTWDDPKIAALNEFALLDGSEIIISPTALAPARDAFEAWIETETGVDLDLSFIEPSAELETEALFSLSEGELRISSYAYALTTGYPFANLATIPGDLTSIVVPDASGIQSAGTQLDYAKDPEAGTVTVKYNKENPPQPLLGAIEPVPAYPPIFAISIAACGRDTSDVRDMARYFVRLDAQGVLETGLTSPLPERVRIASAALIDSGNPEIDLETLVD